MIKTFNRRISCQKDKRINFYMVFTELININDFAVQGEGDGLWNITPNFHIHTENILFNFSKRSDAS